ncbi:MAG: hypothetical protein IPM04_09005 [Saprospiraceae bacterium]|nr:hypothetical protein [Candidatus Brachybacter algidus]MBK8747996.1 hypothetical protein [Candidatus Brachybacter algidus]
MGDISKVQIDIQAFNLQGKSATVSVNQVNGTSNQQLQSKTINIANSNFFQTLEFAIPLIKQDSKSMLSMSLNYLVKLLLITIRKSFSSIFWTVS